jgi:hypothetical protein
MEVESVYRSVWHHLRTFFAGHTCKERLWTRGPAVEVLPRLRVAEFAPGPKTGLWVYATVGGWEAREDPRLEFLIAAPEQDKRQVELLTMTAWYHRQRGLGTEYTFPIGEQWLPGSACDFFLVSLPYPFGPQLEVCNFSDWHLHVLWLLPITTAEREFKVREGQEALEQRFAAYAWSIGNPSGHRSCRLGRA